MNLFRAFMELDSLNEGYGRRFGNYERMIRQAGIPATFIKNKTNIVISYF